MKTILRKTSIILLLAMVSAAGLSANLQQYLLLGDEAYQSQRYKKAAGFYEAYLKSNTLDSEVRYKLANSYLMLNKSNEAAEHLNVLHQQIPGSAESWSLAGLALQKQSKHNEAKAAYEKALILNPEHQGAQIGLNTMLDELGMGEDESKGFKPVN